MRLLGIDIETTGLDREKDFITEIGWAIVDTEIARPLVCESHLLWNKDLENIEEFAPIILELTHIDKAMCNEFGKSFADIFDLLQTQIEKYRVDYLVAHNGASFDQPFLERYVERLYGVSKLPKKWIDTYTDVEYPKIYKHRTLTYLCAEHGFVNPFPHAALFDVLSMLKMLQMYDLDRVVARMKEPNMIIRAMVDFKDKDLAKERRYYWQDCAGKTYVKCWVKQIKSNELESERAEAPFEVNVISVEDDYEN